MHLILVPKACSSSPSGENQVDGLPPASNSEEGDVASKNVRNIFGALKCKSVSLRSAEQLLCS
jgi:hypothetical protein